MTTLKLGCAAAAHFVRLRVKVLPPRRKPRRGPFLSVISRAFPRVRGGRAAVLICLGFLVSTERPPNGVPSAAISLYLSPLGISAPSLPPQVHYVPPTGCRRKTKTDPRRPPSGGGLCYFTPPPPIRGEQNKRERKQKCQKYAIRKRSFFARGQHKAGEKRGLNSRLRGYFLYREQFWRITEYQPARKVRVAPARLPIVEDYAGFSKAKRKKLRVRRFILRVLPDCKNSRPGERQTFKYNNYFML